LEPPLAAQRRAAEDLSDLVSPRVNEARNESGTARWAVPLRVQDKNPLVEVLAAYLNPANGVHKLRAALSESRPADTSSLP
jgi:hypothetical protein